MMNHNFETSNRYRPSDRLKIATYATVGAAAISGVLINTFGSDPDYDIKNRADISVPVIMELPKTPEQDNLTFEFRTIEEGEATGVAVEDAVINYSNKHDVVLKKGQSDVIKENTDSIDYAIRLSTGGSVQPDTKLKSWVDPETGYILTTYVEDSIK